MLLAVDAETVRQLTVSGLFKGCSFGLVGAGFALILGVTGRFHFAYSATYTLAVYLAFTFTARVELPFWPSAALGVLLAASVGAGIERFVYRPLARNAGPTALLAVFVAALGLGIAGENLIRIFWGSANQAYKGPKQQVHEFWDTTFVNFDVWSAATGLLIVVLLTLMLKYSALGRRIKATRVNPDLAQIIGIDAGRTYLICFFLGTLCAGVAAVFSGLKFTVEPAMGGSPTIYAFVVAFLAGTASSPLRVFGMGIVVALIENYSSIWLSTQWTQTAVFVLLVGYLSVLAFRQSALSARFRRKKPSIKPSPELARS